MDKSEALKSAFRTNATLSKRERRAARTRARALSPVRIILSLMSVPVVATGLTVSIYIRTSPYEPPDALRHLIAMSGCDAAAKVGVAPALRGQLGYHPRNDDDGDGVACGSIWSDARPEVAGDFETVPELAQLPDGTVAAATPAVRSVGGAKFLRP
jgi:hypothetical protein